MSPLAVALVLVVSVFAAAHQGTVSYADLEVAGAEVRITVFVAYEDWLPIVDLDTNRDGALATDEVRRHLRRLESYVRGRLAVTVDGSDCPGEAADVDVGERLGAPFTALHLVYRCPAPVRRLHVASALFAREHPGHRTLATVRLAPGLTRQHVFGPGTETLDVAVEAAATPREAIGEFLRLGIEHIFTGYDHIAFLLGLLLVARSLGDLLRVVTAFTAAHTLTLVLATLGWVRLEPRLVESVIALSIAYVAVENLVGREHRRRWIVAFLFGLVHGFGFSNVLREMRIPPGVLAWSLASFNLGVEVGQVMIVSFAYPLLALTRRRAWGPWVVRVASAAIGLAGLYWFFERSGLL